MELTEETVIEEDFRQEYRALGKGRVSLLDIYVDYVYLTSFRKFQRVLLNVSFFTVCGVTLFYLFLLIVGQDFSWIVGAVLLLSEIGLLISIPFGNNRQSLLEGRIRRRLPVKLTQGEYEELERIERKLYFVAKDMENVLSYVEFLELSITERVVG